MDCDLREFKIWILASKAALFGQFIWNIRHAVNGKKFYGQTGEDAILRMILPEKNGFYLDIGAGNPIKSSNTYYFYRKGWSGIVIDPIESNKKLFKILRRRDRFIRQIVSGTKNSLNFWEFIPNEYSTSDPIAAEKLISQTTVKLKAQYQVQALRISDLNLVASPVEPTLLSIDVEGMDFDVLKSNNWNQFLPRVIAVEEWLNSNEIESDLGAYLKNLGYVKFAWTSLTSIYVHEIFFLQNRINKD